jgi:hypothetical protein
MSSVLDAAPRQTSCLVPESNSSITSVPIVEVPGVYSVSAIVPAGVHGDALSVVVTVAGQSSPGVVTMAVE